MRYYGKQGFKVAKDEAVDRAETAENSLRDANFRGEKAKEETMALEKKYTQIRNDLTASQEEMVKANEKLELKEKTLHQVKCSDVTNGMHRHSALLIDLRT